jgi:hypothetical protein
VSNHYAKLEVFKVNFDLKKNENKLESLHIMANLLVPSILLKKNK